MKIQCEYCGTMMNDTLEKCPSCGAPNNNVRRAASDQPTTIAGLKQWYSDRGLPSYETTRFFIGIDYKEPRAFGIYQDPNTGNFVVYKNKDSGVRAIRYEGTDEAFAVNELLQRLKQEILQQKGNQKPTGNADMKKGILHYRPKNPILRFLWNIFRWFVGICLAGFAAIMVIGAIMIATAPKVGYYEYQGVTYYRSIEEFDGNSWYAYTNDEWSPPLSANNLDPIFENRDTCKPYFVQEKWDSSLNCQDFESSLSARDLHAGIFPEKGYYTYGGKQYYHLEWRYNEGWYVYDDVWIPIWFENLPEEMQHTSILPKHYQGKKYSRSISAPDFSDTIYYQDSIADRQIKKGYYSIGDVIYYHLASDYDYGWYYFDDDDWYAAPADALPEEFSHPSVLEDYYFTPTWDSRTQFTDFEDTRLYKDDKDNWSNSSDSDFDWDSDDSWDSDFSDWDSDW